MGRPAQTKVLVVHGRTGGGKKNKEEEEDTKSRANKEPRKEHKKHKEIHDLNKNALLLTLSFCFSIFAGVGASEKSCPL